jgi:TetR/AcrR family transcriptional regulator, regulator of cefoperazone and chloramphenicol sensitivity
VNRETRRKLAPTREKLMEAAEQVFAELGYYKATVREICQRAGANVAAVNYTFGDKLGLYTETLREALRASPLAQVAAAMEAASSPEELLRGVIRVRLQSLCGNEQRDRAFQIVMHELSQPTPAMNRVIDEAMRPVYARMLKAVGTLIGRPPEHPKTRLCSNSVVGQVLFYKFAQPVLSRLQPELNLTPENLDQIADHIMEFSMAALAEMARRKDERKKGGGHLNFEMRNGEGFTAAGARSKERVRR